jgi:hypothetical protein
MKKLDEKHGESSFVSTQGCYQHLVKCIQPAAKEALEEKMLVGNTEPFYYWNEEVGKLVRGKRNTFLMDYFKRTTGQDRT